MYLLQRSALDNDMELRLAERERIDRLEKHSKDLRFQMQQARDHAHLARYYGYVSHTLTMTLASASPKIPLHATDASRSCEEAQSRSALVGEVATSVAAYGPLYLCRLDIGVGAHLYFRVWAWSLLNIQRGTQLFLLCVYVILCLHVKIIVESYSVFQYVCMYRTVDPSPVLSMCIAAAMMRRDYDVHGCDRGIASYEAVVSQHNRNNRHMVT